MSNEISYVHQSGKIISFTPTTSISPDVYEIWKFFDDHPECLDMDDEDVQELPMMWFRKASLFKARRCGRPATGMDKVVYPTEEECIARAMVALSKQTQYALRNLATIDIQEIQNNVSGLPFRKKVTRKAIAKLMARRTVQNTNVPMLIGNLQTTSTQAKSLQTMSGQTMSGQTMSGQTMSGQTMSAQTISGKSKEQSSQTTNLLSNAQDQSPTYLSKLLSTTTLGANILPGAKIPHQVRLRSATGPKWSSDSE
jgi:hypothetical protein